MSERKTLRTRAALAIALGVIGSLMAAVPASSAPMYYFMGYAGGSYVQVLGGTVQSDFTGQSVISGFRSQAPFATKNRIAGTNVGGGVAKIGAINTYAEAKKLDDGVRIETGARTADVSLLGGLIKVDAVETDTVAVQRPDAARQSSATTFVGLTIAGKKYPVTVPENTTVNIPGVATVVLNASFGSGKGGNSASYGYGLGVTLLKPARDLPAGAVVVLNPTASTVSGAPPIDTPVVGGVGYGTYVKASVGKIVDVDAGRTAAISVPLTGTGGETIENTTVGAKIPGILEVGVVKSTAKANIGVGNGNALVTNRTAGINLLGGLITADAVEVSSRTVKRDKDSPAENTMNMKLVNLVIAGEEIPINVSPNTVIRIGNLAQVTINKQQSSSLGSSIVGLEVILLGEMADVPAGSAIVLAAASSYVIPQN